MKTLGKKLAAVTAMGLASPVVFAQAATDQASMWQTFFDIIALIFMVLLFIGGMAILLFSAFAFAKDYIFSKGPQDEKFSVGKIFAGILLGSILAYPSGAFVLGSSFISDEEVTIDVDDTQIRRPDSGGSGT